MKGSRRCLRSSCFGLPELLFGGGLKGSHEDPSGDLSMLEQVGPRGMGIGQQNYTGTSLGMPGPSVAEALMGDPHTHSG